MNICPSLNENQLIHWQDSEREALAHLPDIVGWPFLTVSRKPWPTYLAGWPFLKASRKPWPTYQTSLADPSSKRTLPPVSSSTTSLLAMLSAACWIRALASSQNSSMLKDIVSVRTRKYLQLKADCWPSWAGGRNLHSASALCFAYHYFSLHVKHYQEEKKMYANRQNIMCKQVFI